MKKLILLTAALALCACSDNNNNNRGTPTPEEPTPPPTVEPPVPTPNASFDVRVVNLTAAQPFSPIALLLHDTSARLFSVGSPASNGLEVLAEGGDNTQLLDEFNSVAQTSGAAPVGPGGSDNLSLSLNSDDTSGVRLSLATMLVNTNDAFTVANSIDVSNLGVGSSMTLTTIAYDAGTEANTEQGAHIPGPAGGGEGFSATRDDLRDQVTMHSGVVSRDDGLSSSDLSQQHRWDNPVARITVTRTQ